MKTIWKFPIHVDDTVAVEMPVGATILPHLEPARLEHGEHGLVIWAVVDTVQLTETRVFHVIGTGNEMPDAPLNYIGTAIDDPFVWHLFERVQWQFPTAFRWGEEAKP